MHATDSTYHRRSTRDVDEAATLHPAHDTRTDPFRMLLDDPALRTLHRRGLDLLNARKASEAIAVFREVLAAAPENLDTWDHLAASLMMLGRYEEAEQAFQQCFRLGCSFPETLSNAARNARYWNKPALQHEHARRLLECDGKLRIEGLRHSAEALRKLGRHPDALAAVRQLLLELPCDEAASALEVRLLLDGGQADFALERCQGLLRTSPDNRALQLSRVEATIALGDMAGGIALAEELLAGDPDNVDTLSALGFHYQFLGGMTVARRRAHAERFGEALRCRIEPYRQWSNALDAERPLRIGLVSGDLRRHPVSYFLLNVLQEMKRGALQFFVYDVMGQHDDLTAQIRPLVASWREVQGMKDSDLAELIRGDSIDILLEIQGFMTGNRLAAVAYKPAPVQVSWMGFQGTTGTPGIDYVLADAWCVPTGAEDEFVEKVWRLPGHALCFTPPDVECPSMPPPALANGYLTFGCLNNPYKITGDVLALWSRVLAALPESRLLLKGKGYQLPAFRERFVRRLRNAGIDPQRVTLEGPAPRAQFLQAYNRIDIALDPFPCSGATTTAEALWMGVPVLSLKGDRMVWRMAESLLAACGMRDWLAETPEAYVRLATARARDIQGLAALRKEQRARLLRSPLCNAADFAGRLERTLRDIWREHIRKQAASLRPT